MAYADVYEAWRADPEGFWMEAAQAIAWDRAPTRARHGGEGRSGLVRRRDGERVPQRRRSARGGRARRPGGADPRQPRHAQHLPHHLRRAARRHRAARRGAGRPRRGRGRPGGDLHAHDPRGRGRDAGLRADRRRPFRRVRGLRRARAGAADRRLRAQGRARRVLRDRAHARGGIRPPPRRGPGAGPPRARDRRDAPARARAVRRGRGLARLSGGRPSPRPACRCRGTTRPTCSTPRAPRASPRA